MSDLEKEKRKFTDFMTELTRSVADSLGGLNFTLIVFPDDEIENVAVSSNVPQEVVFEALTVLLGALRGDEEYETEGDIISFPKGSHTEH